MLQYGRSGKGAADIAIKGKKDSSEKPYLLEERDRAGMLLSDILKALQPVSTLTPSGVSNVSGILPSLVFRKRRELTEGDASPEFVFPDNVFRKKRDDRIYVNNFGNARVKYHRDKERVTFIGSHRKLRKKKTKGRRIEKRHVEVLRFTESNQRPKHSQQPPKHVIIKRTKAVLKENKNPNEPQLLVTVRRKELGNRSTPEAHSEEDESLNHILKAISAQKLGSSVELREKIVTPVLSADNFWEMFGDALKTVVKTRQKEDNRDVAEIDLIRLKVKQKPEHKEPSKEDRRQSMPHSSLVSKLQSMNNTRKVIRTSFKKSNATSQSDLLRLMKAIVNQAKLFKENINNDTSELQDSKALLATIEKYMREMEQHGKGGAKPLWNNTGLVSSHKRIASARLFSNTENEQAVHQAHVVHRTNRQSSKRGGIAGKNGRKQFRYLNSRVTSQRKNGIKTAKGNKNYRNTFHLKMKSSRTLEKAPSGKDSKTVNLVTTFLHQNWSNNMNHTNSQEDKGTKKHELTFRHTNISVNKMNPMESPGGGHHQGTKKHELTLPHTNVSNNKLNSVESPGANYPKRTKEQEVTLPHQTISTNEVNSTESPGAGCPEETEEQELTLPHQTISTNEVNSTESPGAWYPEGTEEQELTFPHQTISTNEVNSTESPGAGYPEGTEEQELTFPHHTISTNEMNSTESPGAWYLEGTEEQELTLPHQTISTNEVNSTESPGARYPEGTEEQELTLPRQTISPNEVNSVESPEAWYSKGTKEEVTIPLQTISTNEVNSMESPGAWYPKGTEEQELTFPHQTISTNEVNSMESPGAGYPTGTKKVVVIFPCQNISTKEVNSTESPGARYKVTTQFDFLLHTHQQVPKPKGKGIQVQHLGLRKILMEEVNSLQALLLKLQSKATKANNANKFTKKNQPQKTYFI
nr:PREDICTED: uncharacterized protein LOC102349111 [Latimeria chalumnae]|eukprot:XP_014347263.1 PREDICTED: uncharacterized protein LOC102349111 [Latimeria chalumnae]